jgi:hypothetical protein
MAPQAFRDERRRWVAWVLWYMDTHPDEVPTKTELARRLGVGKSALTPLLDPASDRAPSFETLLASKTLIGASIDTLLYTEPPSIGSRKR